MAKRNIFDAILPLKKSVMRKHCRQSESGLDLLLLYFFPTLEPAFRSWVENEANALSGALSKDQRLDIDGRFLTFLKEVTAHHPFLKGFFAGNILIKATSFLNEYKKSESGASIPWRYHTLDDNQYRVRISGDFGGKRLDQGGGAKSGKTIPSDKNVASHDESVISEKQQIAIRVRKIQPKITLAEEAMVTFFPEYLPLIEEFYLNRGLSLYQFFPLEKCKEIDDLTTAHLRATFLGKSGVSKSLSTIKQLS